MADRGHNHGQTSARYSGTGRRSRPVVVLLVLSLAAGLFLIGGVGGRGSESATSSSSSGAALGVLGQPRTSTDALITRIGNLQTRLRAVPADYVSWASLGLTYVEQARVPAAPALYAKAEGALQRSLSINTADNFAAQAGLAALAAGRHDFAEARARAEQGLAVNMANPTLYGVLADAEIQLGRYDEAFAAIQRMVDLRPDTASLARASYAWELRGDLAQAREGLRRALDDAVTPADRAFARYYLGELDFHAGDPAAALRHYEAGLRADPSYGRLLEGKAKAEAALGRIDRAIADYTMVVEQLPEPAYLVQFAELLEALGRTDAANGQYALFETVTELFEGNGVVLDVEPALFYADHGDPARALRYAEAGIASGQFLEVADAYAWALHANGRDAEALEWSDKALALGTRNAQFHFHAGMIRHALGDMDGARVHLAEALAINPHFSPLRAPVARQALDALEGRR